MRGYSLDLRERVIKAVEADKQSVKEVAQRFSISRWTVNRYIKRAKAGRLAETTRPGQPSQLSEEGFKNLSAQVSEHQDWTLEQHAQALSQSQGKVFKKSVIGKYMQRMGLTIEQP